jgi:predicted small metal-binding protein
MKAIGCRDIDIDCPWETVGEEEDGVLHDLAQHAIDVHKVWPEDGPIQTWHTVRALVRDVSEGPRTGAE